jgi:hypothetical protein
MWEVNQREMERRVQTGEPLPAGADGQQITPEQVAAWRTERGPGEIYSGPPGVVAVQGATGVSVGALVPFESVELAEIAEEIGMAARCVAACGTPADLHPDDKTRAGCPVHPDGAHRCYRAPDHLEGHGQPDNTGGKLGVADHQCDCDFIWISLGGGMAEVTRTWNMGADDALRRVIRHLNSAEDLHAAIQIVQRVAREMGASL